MNPDPTKYEPDPGLRAPRNRLRYLNLALAGVAAAGVLFWVPLVVGNAGVPSFWQRDWYCLWSVGSEYLAGRRAGFYVNPCAPGFMWLYPPYVIYPWAVIALLPALAAYLTVIFLTVALFALSVALLARALPAERPFATVALAGAASAAFNATLVTGQQAGLLLVAVSGALWAAHRERHIATGLFIALLGFKPNWVLLLVAWLLVSRRWKALATTALAGTVMVASTLPMGTEIWREFFATGGERLAFFFGPEASGEGYPAMKLITAEAFFRSLFGPGDLHRALWLGSAICALAACIFIWFRSSDLRSQLAATVLTVVATNPYASFYDALVLLVPAAVWWTVPSLYPRGPRLLAGAAALAVWIVQWVSLYGIRRPDQPSLVGGLLLAWLGAETWRAARRQSPSTTRRGSPGREHSAGD